MGGHLLDSKAEAGGLSTKALGPDAQLVDGRQQLLLQCRVIGVRVGDIQRAEEGLLGKIRHLIKAAAHADAQHDGRAGVGTCLLHGVQHELLKALHAIGGLEHLDAAHILAAKSLWGPP